MYTHIYVYRLDREQSRYNVLCRQQTFYLGFHPDSPSDHMVYPTVGKPCYLKDCLDEILDILVVEYTHRRPMYLRLLFI